MQTINLVPCDGKINNAGFCDKCCKLAQTSSAVCGRLVEYKPNETSTVLAVSGLQKLFCKVHSDFYGEKVDNIEQIVIETYNGSELYELCLRFHQAACASGAVDKTVSEETINSTGGNKQRWSENDDVFVET